MNDFATMPNAGDLTKLTFLDYYFRLMLLSQSVFEWKGLPEEIDERNIEKYLFNEGKCMLFKDKSLGWMVTKCVLNGQLNYYDDPTTIRPVATNYVDVKDYTPGEDCALIRNNNFMIPTKQTIRLFAYRITEIQRTADINITAQKTPVIVKGSEKQRLSLKQVFRQWIGNEPLIFGDKSLDTTEMKALNIAAPFVADKLSIEKNKIWNECMTFLGVDNANTDKKERSVDDEIQANNEQIELSGHAMLQAREKAAKVISELTGQEVSVSIRTTNRGKQDPSTTHKTLQPGGDPE